MNTQTLNETQLTGLDDMLDRIVADTNLHTAWINTLSFLEHCGARKIHRTDFGSHLDETILSHAAEEARHALFYKKMVRKNVVFSRPEALRYNVLKGCCPNALERAAAADRAGQTCCRCL